MSSVDKRGSLVGTLAQWQPQLKTASNHFPLYSDVEIYIGRDKTRCQYTIEDPFVSNSHVRVYTIIFDQENPGDVAPLVYAQDLSMNGTLWNGYPMSKGRGSFLLSDGDILTLSSNVQLIFCCDDCIERESFDMVQQIEIEVLRSRYAITQRKLGSGAYGQVYMAYKEKTGQQLACKIVDFRRMRDRATEEYGTQKSNFFTAEPHCPTDSPSTVVAVRERRHHLSKKIQDRLEAYSREALILEQLCHPNIISVEKVVRSKNTIYLFQELITAGDLFSFIQYKGGRLDDIEAAVIIRQVLLAVEYLHTRDIVHRDLKPDNILMTSLADGSRVVLTDFGCARLLPRAVKRMSTMVGTLEYSAPEVLRSGRQGYTKAVDLWSLGCVTVTLLTGCPPSGKLHDDGYSSERAPECDLERLDEELVWNKTGSRTRDFVRRLLVRDEARRMSIKEALQHDWFTNPAHRGEFEALYRRSVRTWQPRVRSGPLIVDFSSFTGIKSEVTSQDSGHIPSAGLSNEVFQETSEHPIETQFHRHREISPTLSDPALPPHSRSKVGLAGSADQPLLALPQAAQRTERDDANMTGQVSSSTNYSIQTPRHFGLRTDKGIDEIRACIVSTAEETSCMVGHRAPLQKGTTESLDMRVVHDRGAEKCVRDDIEGVVYEQVNNMITGKSESRIYGTERRWL